MLHRKIFGRKRVVAPPDTPAPDVAAGATTTFDRLFAQASALGFRGDSIFQEHLKQMSRSERSELIISLAGETDEMRAHDWTADKRARYRQSAIMQSVELGIAPEAEHLQPLVILLCDAHFFQPRYSSPLASKMLTALGVAINKGGYLTPQDCDMLRGYADRARAQADKAASNKPERKRCLAMAESVDRLTGDTVSATSLLLERLEDTEYPFALGALPAHFDFWASVMAAIAAALHGLAGDLRQKRLAPWMKSAAEFDRLFPATGEIAPRFGQWNDDALRTQTNDWRDFAYFRGLLKQRRILAPVEIYTSARAWHDAYAPMTRHRWDTATIPLVERFGDLEDADTMELLERFIITKDGTRAPVKWLKDTLAVVERQGLSAVQDRLQHWLEAFHTPCPSDQTMADAWHAEVMADTAEQLSAAYPDWPTAIAPEQVPSLGAAVAMQLACGSPVEAFSMSRLTMGLYDKRRLDLYGLGGQKTGDQRYSHHVQTALVPSLENEQFLRAVIWLVPHLPDTASAIVTLERCALAGISMKSGRSTGHRARTATSAAIAGLQTIGTPDALLALNRLIPQIEDRAIQTAIRAGITA